MCSPCKGTIAGTRYLKGTSGSNRIRNQYGRISMMCQYTENRLCLTIDSQRRSQVVGERPRVVEVELQRTKTILSIPGIAGKMVSNGRTEIYSVTALYRAEIRYFDYIPTVRISTGCSLKRVEFPELMKTSLLSMHHFSSTLHLSDTLHFL